MCLCVHVHIHAIPTDLFEGGTFILLHIKKVLQGAKSLNLTLLELEPLFQFFVSHINISMYRVARLELFEQEQDLKEKQ